MRKILISIMAFSFITAMLVTSCKREEFTENDALLAQSAKDAVNHYIDSITSSNQVIRDSMNHLGGVIQYSVNVIDASDASFTKSSLAKSGLDSCLVTISQFGMTKTAKTGSNGIAVFNDLRIGSINVNILKTGYTEVDYIATLNPVKDTIDLDSCCGTADYYNVPYYAATMVPVFIVTQPSASTIEGLLTYESDLTNTMPEPMSGAEIMATINTDDNTFKNNYITPLNNESYTGKITEIAYSSTVFRTVSDVNGDFSIDVPSTADGLPIRINVSEFATTQTLLMNTLYGIPVWGKQQVRAIFSSATAASNIAVVPGAYVTFSTPTGTPAEAPDVAATANAVLTGSGIESVNINNAGNFYTQIPILKVSTPSATEGEMAKVHAVLTNGKVTDVVIDNAGSGYAPNQIVTISEDPNYSPSGAAGTPVISYSIIDITVGNPTANIYNTATTPNIIITSAAGSGATAQAVMSGFVDKATLINGGSGYIAAPDVVVESSPTGNPTDDATGTANMTDYNPLYRIDYIAATPAKYETTPPVEIQSTIGGGATAVAVLKTQGNVKTINLINPGSGYDPNNPPAIYITGGDGAGATAYATVAAGGTLSGITVGDIGFGYTSTNPPTLTIAAPPSGGTTATGSIVLEFELDRIDLTNPGAGYNVTYDPNAKTNSNPPTILINNVALTTNTEVLVYPNMSLEDVTITGGNYYTTAPSVSFAPVNELGSGARAITSLKYHLAKVNMITNGSGYESPSSDIQIKLDSPPEDVQMAATLTASLGDAVLESITLTDGGINYSAAPMVQLITGGNDAGPSITTTVSNGSVTQFTVSDGSISRSYDTPAEATVASFTVKVTYFTNQAAFSAQANPLSGQIEFINVATPGQGYKSTPIVEIVRNNTVSSGNFVDAQAQAVITDGRVTAINITNPGNGYYSTPIINIIVKNYVETAKGACIINYTSGRITGVDFTTSGTTKGAGYITAPTITFTANLPGMGDGASGIAIINNGSVEKVIMTNQGQGYLGRNYWIGAPTALSGSVLFPLPSTSFSSGANYTGGIEGVTFTVYSGKNYVKDIYMGTGYRPINQ